MVIFQFAMLVYQRVNHFRVQFFRERPGRWATSEERPNFAIASMAALEPRTFLGDAWR